jgi:hypothetical protein
MALTLPTGWRAVPVSILRSELAQMSATATGGLKAQADQTLSDIDAGTVRLVAMGPSGFAPWQGSLVIQVFVSESAKARIDALESTNAAIAPVLSSDRSTVALLIGTAIRLSMTLGPPKGLEQSAIPAHGLAYALDLVDGRTMVINASGPGASPTFVDLIDMVVSTLRPR